MCGIAFKRRKDFEDYFTLASKRGMDGFGIVSKSRPTKKFYAETLSEWKREDGQVWNVPEGEDKKVFKGYQDMYNYMLQHSLNGLGKDDFALIHHRKATSGSKSIDNVHPFVGERFTVMQNGTTKEFEGWGEVEGMELGRPDSFYLGEWINRQGSFDEIVVKLSRMRFTIGVIIVVDNVTKEILFFSDGERSFHFEIKKDKIVYASSLDDEGEDIHKNKGYMVFNFNGKIIKNGIEEINEANRKTYYTAPSVPANTPTVPARQTTMDRFDRNDPYYKDNTAFTWQSKPFGIGGEWVYTAKLDDINDSHFSGLRDYIWSHDTKRWVNMKQHDYDRENSVLAMFEPERPSQFYTPVNQNQQNMFSEYGIDYNELIVESLVEELDSLYDRIYDDPIRIPKSVIEKYYETCEELATYDEEGADYYLSMLK